METDAAREMVEKQGGKAMTTIRTAALALMTLGVIVPFSAAHAADGQLQELKAAKGDVAAAARQESHQRFFSKGGPQWRTSSRGRELQGIESEIDGLIDDLERGKAVSPGEVGRVLRQAEGATQ